MSLNSDIVIIIGAFSW